MSLLYVLLAYVLFTLFGLLMFAVVVIGSAVYSVIQSARWLGQKVAKRSLSL